MKNLLISILTVLPLVLGERAPISSPKSQAAIDECRAKECVAIACVMELVMGCRCQNAAALRCQACGGGPVPDFLQSGCGKPGPSGKIEPVHGVTAVGKQIPKSQLPKGTENQLRRLTERCECIQPDCKTGRNAQQASECRKNSSNDCLKKCQQIQSASSGVSFASGSVASSSDADGFAQQRGKSQFGKSQVSPPGKRSVLVARQERQGDGDRHVPSVECGTRGAKGCSPSQVCVRKPGASCGPETDCGGVCQPRQGFPECGTWGAKGCKQGDVCVRKPGATCGPEVDCGGICVPQGPPALPRWECGTRNAKGCRDSEQCVKAPGATCGPEADCGGVCRPKWMNYPASSGS